MGVQEFLLEKTLIRSLESQLPLVSLRLAAVSMPDPSSCRSQYNKVVVTELQAWLGFCVTTLLANATE